MFMPPLSDVLKVTFHELFVTRELLTHVGYSFARAGTGFCLAAVVGITLGILMGRSRVIELFVDPLISAIFPTPKLALFPLMMVLLGIGDASKIALIFMGCFFPIVISTYTGVKNVDKYFIWNARTKGASNRQVLLTVVLPAALPFIFAGLRVATSTAFLLIVASELIASNEGLGFLILYAQRSFHPGADVRRHSSRRKHGVHRRPIAARLGTLAVLLAGAGRLTRGQPRNRASWFDDAVRLGTWLRS